MAVTGLKGIRRVFRKLGKRDPSAKVATSNAFENLVEMAKEIAAVDPRGLHAFVVSILRPLQSEQILGAAERSQHSAPASIVDWTFFMGEADSNTFSFSQLAAKDPESFEVDLARDLVLPTMWHRQSVASAFGAIGTGLKCGSWRQDSNHQVSLWLPWRIAFVLNGNHSIAAGIVRAEGKLRPSSVYDLTPQLRAIRCKGNNYIRVSDGHPVAQVLDQRTAAVWEIGRLMAGLG
jgi:hypothetical protein